MLSFYAHYALALASVALMLYGLKFAVTRVNRRTRRPRGRYLRLAESLQLGNATLHAVRVADRCVIVGACGSRLTLLTEVPHDASRGSEVRELPDLARRGFRKVDLEVGPDGHEPRLRAGRGNRIFAHRW